MPNPNIIRLYAVNCAQLDPADALPLLTEDRVAHIARLRDVADKRRSAAAGLLLRFSANQLLGTPAFTVARGHTGKPYLPDYPEFHFSLSHSGSWAICAAGFCPVGADIQYIRSVSAAFKSRFFCPEEQVLCTDDTAAIRLFCAREAYGKLTETGISREPVSLIDDQLQICGLHIAEPQIAEGYRVCICTEYNAKIDIVLPIYEQLLCK